MAKIYYGASPPSPEHKRLLTDLDFNLADIKPTDLYYSLYVPESPRHKHIKKEITDGKDPVHIDEILFNEVRVIRVETTFSILGFNTVFHVDEANVRRALAISDETSVEDNSDPRPRF